MPPFEELKVFSGTAHPVLTESICEYLGVPLGEAEVFKYANDNTFVQFSENIRQCDVFLVQPFAFPVNESIMELLIMIDAARRASAGRVTAVIPYYAYGRTDKKDQPRVPITARLVADLITTAGADRALTVDLHAGQIQGFFNIPVDELTALPLLSRYILNKKLRNPVAVAVDIGGTKRARNMAERIQASLAIVEKRRMGNDDTLETLNVIGEVSGREAVMVDDEIATGNSIIATVDALRNRGVAEVYACCTHGVLSGDASQRLSASSIEELVITDTLPLDMKKITGKTTILSVAPLLGEAIHRIHNGLSIGAMFE